MASRPVPDLHADGCRGLGDRGVLEAVEVEGLGVETGLVEVGPAGIGDDDLVQVCVGYEGEGARGPGHAEAFDSSYRCDCQIEVGVRQTHVDQARSRRQGHSQSVLQCIDSGGLHEGGVRCEVDFLDSAGIARLEEGRANIDGPALRVSARHHNASLHASRDRVAHLSHGESEDAALRDSFWPHELGEGH